MASLDVDVVVVIGCTECKDSSWDHGLGLGLVRGQHDQDLLLHVR